MSAAETNDTTAPQPALDEIHQALPKLLEEICGDMKKEVLASIYEAAIAPIAGRRYPDEIHDLCGYIIEAGRQSESLGQSVLAVGFNHDMWYETFNDRFPYLREAACDLARAVAVYFARTNAYWVSLDAPRAHAEPDGAS